VERFVAEPLQLLELLTGRFVGGSHGEGD
jgi:hypothetical protein